MTFMSEVNQRVNRHLIPILRPILRRATRWGRARWPSLSMQCRVLTAGEREIAEQVFAGALRLDSIRLCSSPWILKNYAMSPNGSVYFHPEDLAADFSQTSLMTQSWLVHELVHVWQVQQGMNVVRRALFNRRYSYTLRPGKSFYRYGIEQQAQIVQDWFIQHVQGQECAALAAILPFKALSQASTATNNPVEAAESSAHAV